MSEDPSVSLFREYLRINTVQPDPDYGSAASFLRRVASELGFECQVFEFVAGKPVVLMTWEGTQPELSSILLNSHIDVVPVYPEKWKHDPFGAVKEDNGDIYARGSQDMKCVGIQYVEALRRLKAEGKRFPRTFHVLWVPDEEIGGADGAAKFIESEQFTKLNVGFGLDEGLANPTDVYKVFYAERSVLWVKVICPGEPGHASRLPKNTAGEKLQKVVNAFMKFRQEQSDRLKNDPALRLGDVTSVNLTFIEGGRQLNIIPAELSICFDMRVSHDRDIATFEKDIEKWCQEAGEGVTVEVLQRSECSDKTSVNDDNIWWTTFKKACSDLNMKLETEVQSCNTDLRFFRRKGVPCLGFHAVNHTPILLHDHNEYLNEKQFLKGIDIYKEILPALASVPKF